MNDDNNNKQGSNHSGQPHDKSDDPIHVDISGFGTFNMH